MAISEKEIENQCLDWLNKQCGTLAIKIKTEGTYSEKLKSRLKLNKYVLKGTPDCLVMIKNIPPFFIEFKAETGKQSIGQRVFENKCKNLGVKYFVCRSLEDTKEVFELIYG